MRRLACFLLLTIIPTLTGSARADELGTPRSSAEMAPRADAVKPAISLPHPVTLYIRDWEHLADVTRPDALVFNQADSLASRYTASRQIATSGLLVGGTAAAAGTISRLTTDHWTGLTKWSVTGGLSLVIVSLVTAWLVAPDRADLVSVVNDWNQVHPDRPLAP
jgi:hypothetical protein